MVIHKGQQMLSFVQCPIFRSKLPKQRMDNLKHIHTVKAAEKPFIALIVCCGMKHTVIHQAVIIPMQHLPNQEELLLQPTCKTPKPAHKSLIQAIRHIQAQSVNIKFLHPRLHTVQKIIYHIFIVKVEFHQIIISLPPFIPEAIIIMRIAVKSDSLKPAYIGRWLSVAKHILKWPKPPSHMVKHTIQHHSDSIFMESITDLFEIFIGSQPCVHFPVIPCIISMGVRFKKGWKINRVNPQFLDMRNPLQYFQYTMLWDTVILKWCPAESQWINLIKNAFICPHTIFLLF